MQTETIEFLKIIAVYAGSLLTLITFLVTALNTANKFSTWFANKIIQSADMSKRDDYVDRRSFDLAIEKILNRISDLDDIRIVLKRLEYLTALQHNPNDEITINMIYDEYKKMLGNSYVDMTHAEWMNEINENKEDESRKRNRKKINKSARVSSNRVRKIQ